MGVPGSIRILSVVLIGFAGLSVPVCASPILSGSVTQNGPLYTYSYGLDNSSGPGPINELSILIDSAAINLTENPLSSTSPLDWNFHVAFSGGIANPPYNEFGTFWQWGGTDLSVGQTLGGFSFTTTVAPTTLTNNNYFLFCPDNCGSFTDGIVEYGHIVAPDFAHPTPQVPEPNSFGLTLLCSALVIISSNRLHRWFRH
jgi:hypothetical protein